MEGFRESFDINRDAAGCLSPLFDDARAHYVNPDSTTSSHLRSALIDMSDSGSMYHASGVTHPATISSATGASGQVSDATGASATVSKAPTAETGKATDRSVQGESDERRLSLRARWRRYSSAYSSDIL